MYVLVVVWLILTAVVLHEAGHALAGILTGQKLTRFYIGIPLDYSFRGIKRTLALKMKIRGVEVGISPILLGGMVEFDESHNQAPLPVKLTVVAAGPLANLFLGMLPMFWLTEFGNAIRTTVMICRMSLAALWSIFAGAVPMAQVQGPVGSVAEMAGLVASSNAWLTLWILLNLSLFIFNILPIPALDGGWMVKWVVDAIFGQRAQPLTTKISAVFYWLWMVVMLLAMTKDLW